MHVTVKGAEVYAYTGSRPFDPARPALLFVHGAAHDHSVWALQSRYFAFHGWNVLAVDLPGHGRSGGDVLESVEAIADWLVAVLDAAAIERAALVGHSMGSLAVLDCAGRHAERVTHAALIGPALPMAVSDALLDAARQDDHLAFDLINGWSYSARKQRGGNQVPGMWMTGNAMRLLERSRPGVLYRDLLACRAYVAGIEAARGVRCPALLILAARDIMAPVKMTRELATTLPQVRVVTLPVAGHAMMAEEPDAVLDALRGFLPAA